MAAILLPESSGRVVVADDPASEPFVDFDVSVSDRERLVAAEVVLRQLVERPPFAAILAAIAEDVAPGGYAHACGSCRAALDERGAVRGTEGLYVCDASALPALPAGGPMVATVAWAERFARRFS
jgi:choline dehydrogenase-like flavoprotein